MTYSTKGPRGLFTRTRAPAICAAIATATLMATAPALADGQSGVIRLAQAATMAPAAPAGETIKVGDLVLTAPWTRATPGGAKVAGGFVRITNNGKAADKLIGGSASLAGRFEVHEMSMQDGVMRMRPVTGGLEIKPGATVELKPGSYHVMFMDIKEQFKEGQTVKAMLEFEKAGKVEVNFRVGGVGEGAGSAHGKH